MESLSSRMVATDNKLTTPLAILDLDLQIIR
jgi:hypothetical protein